MTASPNRTAWHDFITEVLGIDGKGFRLMRDVLWRPGAVFEAFMAEDQERYAPPIRVWLWVFGVKTLTLIFIGGVGGMFSRINAAQHEKNFGALLARLGVDLDRFLDLANSWWSIVNPVIVLILSIPAAFILAMLKPGKHFASHANIYLSAYLAASLVSLAIITPVLLLAPSLAGFMGFLSAAVFGLTFARGGGAALYFRTRSGAIVKTVFVSAVFFLTTALASFILLFTLIAYAKANPAG